MEQYLVPGAIAVAVLLFFLAVWGLFRTKEKIKEDEQAERAEERAKKAKGKVEAPKKGAFVPPPKKKKEGKEPGLIRSDKAKAKKEAATAVEEPPAPGRPKKLEIRDMPPMPHEARRKESVTSQEIPKDFVPSLSEPEEAEEDIISQDDLETAVLGGMEPSEALSDEDLVSDADLSEALNDALEMETGQEEAPAPEPKMVERVEEALEEEEPKEQESYLPDDEEEEIDLSMDDLDMEGEEAAAEAEDVPEIEVLKEREEEALKDLEGEPEIEWASDDSLENASSEDLVDEVLRESGRTDNEASSREFMEVDLDELDGSRAEEDEDIDIDETDLGNIGGFGDDEPDDDELGDLLDVEIPDLDDEETFDEDESINAVLDDLETPGVGADEARADSSESGIFGDNWITEIMDESPAAALDAPQRSQPVKEEQPKDAHARNIEKARRLAKVIARDIKNYNGEKVKEGVSKGDISGILETEIGRGKEHYLHQVPTDIANPLDYYYDALVEVLAGGNRKLVKPLT